MSFDPNLLAHIEQWTGRAAWQVPRTDMFAERNQETVDLYPVLLRQYGFECGHGVYRGTSLDVPPTVGDTVNMDVDPNTWLMTPDTQHQVRAFGPNPSERA
jgi:hypothetical protein